ncbi:MAG: response regulator, partial [Candidatus Acidiferrum sp.]
TSICRSSVTICSGLYFLVGIPALLQSEFSLTSAGTKNPGQVSLSCRIANKHQPSCAKEDERRKAPVSESNKKNEIVSGVDHRLAQRNTGLVRRGLKDLASLAINTRKRIIVADDEEALNEVFGEILKSAGYEIRTTVHPSEVVALVEEFRPDIAIIGLITPEIDGVKLSQKLFEHFPRLTIVLTGEEVEEEILQHLLAHGINCDTLEPPLEKEDLLVLVKTWATGSTHVDPISRLRDAKHFEIGLARNIRYLDHNPGELPVIFIEIFPYFRSRPGPSLTTQAEFLRALGATLAAFARRGFAYRNSDNLFTVLLPNVSKERACEISVRLKTEIDLLLRSHKLHQSFSVAIGLVGVPHDAQSVQKTWDEGQQLIAGIKRTGHGGVALRRVRNRKRILVFYEEAINEVFCEILSSVGHEVRMTTEASEVLSLAEDFKPDVALIHLLGSLELNGIDLSRRLSERLPGLKIVFLWTGPITSDEKLMQYLRENCARCDTFKLPSSREGLLEMIDRY